MRKPSEDTLLKRTKRTLRLMTDDRNREHREALHYKARAEKAERELFEWKTRFDKLLERDAKPAPPKEG